MMDWWRDIYTALKKADISRLAKKYLINPQIHVLLYEKALQLKSAK